MLPSFACSLTFHSGCASAVSTSITAGSTSYSTWIFAERLLGEQLAVGRDRGDRVADVARLVLAQRLLVLGPRDDAEVARAGRWPVITACTPGSASAALASIDTDARVRVDAAQQLAVQHARQREVVGVDRAAGDLGQALDLAVALADDEERRRSGGACDRPRPRRRRRADPRAASCGPPGIAIAGLAPAGSRAARLRARALAHARAPPARPPRRSSCSRCSGTGCPTARARSRRASGSGCARSSAHALIRIPGVQNPHWAPPVTSKASWSGCGTPFASDALDGGDLRPVVVRQRQRDAGQDRLRRRPPRCRRRSRPCRSPAWSRSGRGRSAAPRAASCCGVTAHSRRSPFTRRRQTVGAMGTTAVLRCQVA